MRRVPSKHRNRPLVRQKEPGAIGRLALLLICGLVLASGFVYAGVQHFGALRLGYKTEKLRNDLEKAREEQKHLLVEREAAASPVRLEQAARRLGMQPMTPAQIDPLGQGAETVAKAAPAPPVIQAPTSKTVPSSAAKQVVKSKFLSAAAQQSLTVTEPIRLQEKPKTSKPFSDQKKSR